MDEMVLHACSHDSHIAVTEPDSSVNGCIIIPGPAPLLCAVSKCTINQPKTHSTCLKPMIDCVLLRREAFLDAFQHCLAKQEDKAPAAV